MRQSEQINELNAALAKAQGEFPHIAKSRLAKVKMRDNKGEYSYKYADLADVLQAILPKLSGNGLSIRQPVLIVDGAMRLFTELHHSSGQFTTDDGFPLNSRLAPQDFAAELSYFRRFGVCGMCAVAPGEDEDSTLAVTAKSRKEESQPAVQAAAARGERALERQPVPPVAQQLLITDEQKTRLQTALRDNKKKAADLYAFLGIPMGSGVPAVRLNDAMAWIQGPTMPANVTQAFEILKWDEYERATYSQKHEHNWPAILESLNNMIDANDAKEPA